MSLFARIFKSKQSAKAVEPQFPPVGYLNPQSTLGEMDLYLIGEGRHERLWEALGAHTRRTPEGSLCLANWRSQLLG